ncbi:hypothetical protein PSQ19_06630 [Devosia algicola]|uniref:Uncharacterized protein n=1 Tax=Devosia algicola TaxID=3026418 RepID=A0ABY7YQW8_9HYPH|nr:hypothetical protein [Devosia algicola]WDR03725.1 hypothetical protein PSQ19_06630 [Devosia algicola]
MPDLARRPPFTVQYREVQFFIPLALKERVLAIMRFKPQTELFQELGGMMVTPVAPYKNSMNVVVVKCQVEHRAYGFVRVPSAGLSRVQDKPQLTLASGSV